MKKEKTTEYGFKWQYLIVYILIASFISYRLVDYKVKRDAPTTEPAGVVVTADENGGKNDKKWTTKYSGELDNSSYGLTISEKYVYDPELETSEEDSSSSTDVSTSMTLAPVKPTATKPSTVKPTAKPSTKPSDTTKPEGSTSATSTTDAGTTVSPTEPITLSPDNPGPIDVGETE